MIEILSPQLSHKVLLPSDGVPHMVSGSTEGHLAVWDLELQELNNTIHHAHHSTIATAHYLASQPLLFTAGADNAIKIWVFDGPGMSYPYH